MDRNRNEDIEPADTEFADNRERTAGKQDSGRTNSDIERGRNAMAGRAGEGNARPGNGATPSDEG